MRNVFFLVSVVLCFDLVASDTKQKRLTFDHDGIVDPASKSAELGVLGNRLFEALLHDEEIKRLYSILKTPGVSVRFTAHPENVAISARGEVRFKLMFFKLIGPAIAQDAGELVIGCRPIKRDCLGLQDEYYISSFRLADPPKTDW